jgi:hypothetical protein
MRTKIITTPSGVTVTVHDLGGRPFVSIDKLAPVRKSITMSLDDFEDITNTSVNFFRDKKCGALEDGNG